MVFDKRLANSGRFQMTIFFANAPADIEPRKVSCGERAHCHAEIGESLIDGFDASSFFNEELRFAAVRAEHAIADKSPPVAHEHSNFAERF